MHSRRAGTRDRYTAIERADHHLGLGFEVVGFCISFPDVVEDLACTFLGIRIAELRCFLRREALHDMSQGINTRCSNDFRRQLGNHVDIEDDVIRDHAIIDNALLRFLFRDGHDGIAGRLRTRAAGRREHDRFRLLVGDAAVFQQITQRVVCADNDAGELGSIHDTAATNANDEIRLALHFCEDTLDITDSRFRRQIFNDRYFRMLAADVFSRLAESQAADPFIRKDQDMLGILTCYDSVEFFNASLSCKKY